MRIVCPFCSAAYEVPDVMLGHGAQRLRCARCAREWGIEVPPPTRSREPAQPAAQPTDIEPPLAAAPSPLLPAAPSRLGVDPRREDLFRPTNIDYDDRPGHPVLGWVLTLAVLVLLCIGAYVWRGQIMSVWPPS